MQWHTTKTQLFKITDGDGNYKGDVQIAAALISRKELKALSITV